MSLVTILLHDYVANYSWDERIECKSTRIHSDCHARIITVSLSSPFLSFATARIYDRSILHVDVLRQYKQRRASNDHAGSIAFTKSIDLFILIDFSDANIFPSDAVGTGTFLD